METLYLKINCLCLSPVVRTVQGLLHIFIGNNPDEGLVSVLETLNNMRRKMSALTDTQVRMP